MAGPASRSQQRARPDLARARFDLHAPKRRSQSDALDALVRLLIGERLVTFVIVLNTALLIALGFYRNDGTLTFESWLEAGLYWADYACTLFFIAEASLKIHRFGWTSYWSRGWNRFDFVVVLVSAPASIAPFVPAAGGWSALLALRTSRLLRFLKLLRFIPDADRIVGGVQRALKASVGVFVGLVLFNLIFSLVAASIFGSLPSEAARDAFGDPLAAFYTIFKVFTVEGWYELPEKIALEVDATWAAIVRIYFMITVVVGGIFGLSIANAIFIDEMVADNNDEVLAQLEGLRGELRNLGARVELTGAGTSPELLALIERLERRLDE